VRTRRLTWHNGKMIPRRELQRILEEEGSPGSLYDLMGQMQKRVAAR